MDKKDLIKNLKERMSEVIEEVVYKYFDDKSNLKEEHKEDINSGNKPTKISHLGIDLVKHFEGCYLKAYLCPANVWTIGYGHTGNVGPVPITEGMTITQETAEQLLKEDMEYFEKAVLRLVKVPLNQAQFDSLVSFSFNVGSGALAKSTLLKLLNKGKYEEVPAQLNRWNKGGGKVLKGLVRRRKAEGYLWTNGYNNFID